MLGIITAMSVESEAILAKMSNVVSEKAACFSFYRGDIDGVRCVLCISGVGKVNAAACTQAMILAYSPSFIVNIGVAGSVDSSLRIGDLVIGESFVQFDVDTSPIGDPKYMISGINRIFIESDPDTVAAALDTARRVFPEKKAVCGRIASSDKFVGGDNFYLREEAASLGALCIEMESGSIAQVALLNSVPYLAVRTVSDSADGGAPESFEHFCIESASVAQSWLCAFIREHLSKKLS